MAGAARPDNHWRAAVSGQWQRRPAVESDGRGELVRPGCSRCAVLAWLALRRPTVLPWLVLATFAVGPQWIFAKSASPALLAWAMPAQMLLLLAALLANVARYSVRLDLINWPLLVVLWLLLQSLLLAELDPAITPPALLAATLSFALPCCLMQCIAHS